MEGHRYADDSGPGWYPGAQYTRAGDGAHAADAAYDPRVHERPSGAFRLPEQRLYDAPADPLATTGSHTRPDEAVLPAPYESGRLTARGPEYPTVRPPETPPTPLPDSAVPPGQTMLVPPVLAPKGPERVYQSRRSAANVIVAVVMVLLLVPVVRLLLDATFARTPSAAAVVPAVLLTLGLALGAIGLFSLTGNGRLTRESWLRPPVAYLPIGLILLVAAGLAAS